MIDGKRLLDTFLEYVRIDSETLNEREMADRLTADFRSVGCQVWRDDAGAAIGSNGYNVYARLTGDSADEPMLFSAHMDTVKPGNGIEPIVRDGVVYSAGDTILASDDKSGVAGIVEALRTITERQLPHRTIEVMISIAEEGGLNGAKHGNYSTLTAKKAVVLDSSGDVGEIITVAPGQIKIEATVTGKAAHAGIAPETGVSAIQAASAAIAEMKLLRIDEETTANIGTFSSEYATNIVPDRAVVKGEARSRSVEKLKAQGEHMRNCLQEACDRYGATLECVVETAYLSFAYADDDPFVREVREACARIGVEATTKATGGGSDANIMNHNGIRALVLATGMDKVHTTDERITIHNLEDVSRLCLALMAPGAA